MANYQPNYIYSPLYGNRYMGGSRTPAPSTGGAGQVDTSSIQSRNTAVGVPYSPIVQEKPLGPVGWSSTGRDQSAVESLGNFGLRDMSGLTMDPFEGTDYISNGFGSPAPINTRYVESVPEPQVTAPVSFNSSGGGGDGGGYDNSAFRNEDAVRMDSYAALGAVNPEFNAQYSAYADAPLVEKIVGGVGLDMYRRANLKDAYNKEALAQGQVMDDVNLLDEYIFGVDPLPDSYRNTATIQDVASARSELAAQGANVSTGPAWDVTQGVYDETDYLDGNNTVIAQTPSNPIGYTGPMSFNDAPIVGPDGTPYNIDTVTASTGSNNTTTSSNNFNNNTSNTAASEDAYSTTPSSPQITEELDADSMDNGSGGNNSGGKS